MFGVIFGSILRQAAVAGVCAAIGYGIACVLDYLDKKKIRELQKNGTLKKSLKCVCKNAGHVTFECGAVGCYYYRLGQCGKP